MPCGGTSWGPSEIFAGGSESIQQAYSSSQAGDMHCLYPTHRFPGTCWGQQPVASSAEVLAHRKLFALHEMPGCLRFGHETGKLFTSV